MRKGGFPERARTLFSTMVHSTSSSWITTSFFKILIAYNSSAPFRSASITWGREEGERGRGGGGKGKRRRRRRKRGVEEKEEGERGRGGGGEGEKEEEEE